MRALTAALVIVLFFDGIDWRIPHPLCSRSRGPQLVG